MESTQAWVVRKIGSEPELQNIGLGPPGVGEVRLRVLATGLNFADLLMIEGRYQDTPPPPFVPGMEMSGVVEEIGTEVEHVSIGDRVMCVSSAGGLARHVVVSADMLRPIPKTMDDTTAASFQITYGTSHLALTRRANLTSGETLIVLGAAGGVGLTAVEIGKSIGARIIAVARGAEKLAVAKNAGAGILIDSETDDLAAALKKAGPANVIYDAVGGDAGDAALKALAPEGRYLIIGFASGRLPVLKPNHLLVKNQTVIGFYWGGYQKFRPNAVEDSLKELCKWYGEGKISPHISHVLRFEEAMDGLDLLRSRKATGKVVIRH